jgi:molecular chaperone DnaJ
LRSRKLATKDLYEILGVNKGSSQDEIQSAYRKLVMQYHPDINKEPDANKKMAEINDAYNTLSDPEKRTKYDTYGDAGLNQEGFPGGYSNNAGDFFRGGGGGSIFDDLINNFFTGGNRDQDSYNSQNAGGQKVSRGSDISFETHVTLEEAIAGKKIKIELDRFEACEECAGSGAKNYLPKVQWIWQSSSCSKYNVWCLSIC